MDKLIENSLNFWFGFWMLNGSDKPKKRKVTPQNARFKVTKKVVKESIFYSNAATPEEAEKEAWLHFNIYSDRVKQSHHVPFFNVEENPHRCIDDDGYDVVTGIRKELP